MEFQSRMGLVFRLVVGQEVLVRVAAFRNKFRTFVEEVVGCGMRHNGKFFCQV